MRSSKAWKLMSNETQALSGYLGNLLRRDDGRCAGICLWSSYLGDRMSETNLPENNDV